MNKKKPVKSQIDTSALKKLLAKLSKDKQIAKSASLATVTLILLVGLFNYTSISKYFSDISSAHVLNDIFEETQVLEGSPLAGSDNLLDLANDGFVYSNYISTNFSNTLRYQRIDSNDVIIPIKNYGSDGSLKFQKAKTDDTYVIWLDNEGTSTENFIYYEEIMHVNPLQDPRIPKPNSNDDDIDADIYNGTIAFIRTGPGNYGSIWTYIPGGLEPTEWPTTNSTKNEIRFDDNKIVWADQRTGNWDIWMIDLNSGNPQEQPVVIADDNQTQPSISNNIVVWTDDRAINNPNFDDYNIWMKDISTADDPIQITTNTEKQYLPSVYNNIIVWEDWRNNDENPSLEGNADVFMYDLNQTTYPPVEKFVAYDDPDGLGYSGSRGNPMINNGYIFWTRLKLLTSLYLDSDIAYTTYDELNLKNPESDIDFNFTDITFEWELKRAGKPLLGTYTLMANNLDDPNDPDFAVNLGGATSFTLKNTLIETVTSDGTWEWWVKAKAPEFGLTEYFSQHRIINKKVAAVLEAPANGALIDETTKFEWQDIDNDPNNDYHARYIARIGGFLDGGKYLYFPLPIPPKQTTLSMAEFPGLYNLLKSNVPFGGTKEYNWSISGTKLPNPLPPKNPQDQWAKLYYGDQWTFKVENN